MSEAAPCGMKRIDAPLIPRTEEWDIFADHEALFRGDGLLKVNGHVVKGFIPWPEVPKTWDQHPRATHCLLGCYYRTDTGERTYAFSWPGPGTKASDVTLVVAPLYTP